MGKRSRLDDAGQRSTGYKAVWTDNTIDGRAQRIGPDRLNHVVASVRSVCT